MQLAGGLRFPRGFPLPTGIISKITKITQARITHTILAVDCSEQGEQLCAIPFNSV